MGLWKNGLFGAAIINKLRYWPANIKGCAIDAHLALKDVVNVDAVKQVEDGLAYHLFCMKEPDYVMKLMTIYVTLEPTDKSAWRKFKRGGLLETKDFMYT